MSRNTELNLDLKRERGQFFTKKSSWLRPHIVDFILATKKRDVVDPFAGNGDLLLAVKKYFDTTNGYDIDPNLGWKINDSFISIPDTDSFCITNPPWLAKNSKSFRNLNQEENYFAKCKWDDLYLLALEKIFASFDEGAVIIPETFVNEKSFCKDRIYSITILEKHNPFIDTGNPCIVATFTKDKNKDIKFYIDDEFVGLRSEIYSVINKHNKKAQIKFNDKNGWLAVRCFDTTDPKNRILFGLKETFDYDWNKEIKDTSRAFTLIEIPNVENKDEVILKCNKILGEIRHKTKDIVLSPFKGNTKDNKRRRRLDFNLCRKIIEEALMSNDWTKNSIKLAKEKNYLDLLFEVYPISPQHEQREINSNIWKNVCTYRKEKDHIKLITELFKLKKFPLDNMYLGFLRKDQDALKRNPEITKKIGTFLCNMSLKDLRRLASAPKSTSRKIGPMFKRWLEKEPLGIKNYKDFESFLKCDRGILMGSDDDLKNFCKKYLNYKRNKGLDFVAKVKNKIIIGETKFISTSGGTQDKSFKDIISLLETPLKSEIKEIEAHKIGIIDGYPLLEQGHYKNDFDNSNEIFISALLLKDYLNSL